MIARLLVLICTVVVLSACSSDGDQARVEPTRTAAVPAPQVQAGPAVAGRLLYVRDKQIWLHEGKNARPLQLSGDVRDPAWSPDGRWIAYIQRGESFSDLYVLDLQSGKSIQVTWNGRTRLEPRSRDYVHAVIWAAKPAWSPDGDEIVFLSQEQPPTGPDQQPPIYEFPLALYRYQTELIGTREPNNSDMLQVQQAESDVLSPAWSPDGRYLAYVQAPRGAEPRRIMLYAFETEEAMPYPGAPEGAYDPAWSPDGKTLAFAVAQGASTDIWTIDEPSSNGTAQRLTKLGRARSPAWSPDGASVAFLNVGESSTDLYVVDLQRETGRITPGATVAVTEGFEIDATAGLSWGK